MSLSIHKDTKGGMQGHLSDSGRLVVKLNLVDKTTKNISWFVKIKPRSEDNNNNNKVRIKATLRIFYWFLVNYDSLSDKKKLKVFFFILAASS